MTRTLYVILRTSPLWPFAGRLARRVIPWALGAGCLWCGWQASVAFAAKFAATSPPAWGVAVLLGGMIATGALVAWVVVR